MLVVDGSVFVAATVEERRICERDPKESSFERALAVCAEAVSRRRCIRTQARRFHGVFHSVIIHLVKRKNGSI